MMKPIIAATDEARPITGMKVLLAFIAFFAVVGGVNAVMIGFATTTFGGVESDSAYREGLAFNREIAAAASQNELGWIVQAEFAERNPNRMRLSVRISDDRKLTPANIHLIARLTHPGDRRRDHEVVMSATNSGTFAGTFDRAAGQWDLVLEAWRDDQRMFRSVNRVGLR
jgi:nitrogen fixation protein FixH